MSEANPYPVFLTSYKRLEHMKATLNALKANPLSSQTKLYVTSDGPMPGDEDAVGQMRDYLDTVSGFKEIERIYRDKNDRHQNWIIRRELLERYGAIIQLEEDCVCSTHFLAYMNEALRRYKNDPEVFAVCAYFGDILPKGKARTVSYKIPRFSAWGFGIWEDRDALVCKEIKENEFCELRNESAFLNTLKYKTGVDYMANLWRVASRGLFGYDLMVTLEVVKRGMSCIYPGTALVRNIGHDGSGEHCKASERFEVELAKEPLDVEVVDPTPAGVLLRHAIFRSGGLKKYLQYRFRLIRGKYK